MTKQNYYMITESVYVIESENDDDAITRMCHWDDDYKDNEFIIKLVKYDENGNEIVIKSFHTVGDKL